MQIKITDRQGAYLINTTQIEVLFEDEDDSTIVNTNTYKNSKPTAPAADPNIAKNFLENFLATVTLDKT